MLDVFVMTTSVNTLPDNISELKGIISEHILNIQKQEEKANRYRGDLQFTQEALARKDAEIESLKELVILLKRHRFSSKSEKVKGDTSQLPLGLFNETEMEEEKSLMQDTSIEVEGHRRRGKPKRVKLPESLPREDVVIDLDEDDKRCPEGHTLKCIGEDISEQLDVIPAQVKVIRTIRKKYACPKCEGHVKRAALPKVAIPKSIAGAGLLAHIATSKYGDGLPLYRQEHMWQRLGVEIPRATMATWMIKVGELLAPVLNLMSDDLLEGGYVHADETKVQVLDEPGKLATSKSYMWVRGRKYPGAPPIIIFEYDPSRAGCVADRMFVNYKGYLQIDGYAGYNGVCKQPDVIRCGCMAHVRRKFFEALKASKKGKGLASEAIDIIRKLYDIEKTIKDKSIEERYEARQTQSKPVMLEFRSWLDDSLGKVPPESTLGKALQYANNEWSHLMRYIEDGRLSIDNNFVENAIRPFVIGRKNWLFSNSVAGANASAAIYSVMISAKQNGHNEYAYFRYLLEKLPSAEKLEDIESLLPHRLSPKTIPDLQGAGQE